MGLVLGRSGIHGTGAGGVLSQMVMMAFFGADDHLVPPAEYTLLTVRSASCTARKAFDSASAGSTRGSSGVVCSGGSRRSLDAAVVGGGVAIGGGIGWISREGSDLTLGIVLTRDGGAGVLSARDSGFAACRRVRKVGEPRGNGGVGRGCGRWSEHCVSSGTRREGAEGRGANGGSGGGRDIARVLGGVGSRRATSTIVF